MSNDREDLINSIKQNMPKKEQMKIVEKMADSYKDKSEEEIFFEIIKVNNEMESELSSEKYNEILDKLKSIRPLLSKTQNEKLDMVLKALNKD